MQITNDVNASKNHSTNAVLPAAEASSNPEKIIPNVTATDSTSLLDKQQALYAAHHRIVQSVMNMFSVTGRSEERYQSNHDDDDRYGRDKDDDGDREFKVSDALKAIRSALHDSDDDDHREKMLEKAREAIINGVFEANVMLQSYGVESRQLQQTKSALQQGVEQLSQAPIAAQDAPAELSASSRTQVAAMGASFEKSQSGELVINTLEGDRVVLSFSNAVQAAIGVATAKASAYGSANGSANSSVNSNVATALSVNAQLATQSSIQFSVEGDLNEHERDAIKNLIEKVDKLSDKFFDNKIQSAFQQASKLGIDNEQLAGFSLSLQSTQVQRVVGAYQSVQEVKANALPNTASNSAVAAQPYNRVENPALTVAPVVNDIKEVANDAQNPAIIADPAKALKGLFELISKIKGFSQDEEFGIGSHAFGQILDHILDRTESEKEEHDKEKRAQPMPFASSI